MIIYMSGYFSKPNSLGRNAKVELNLSNYATKQILKFSRIYHLLRKE